MAEIFKLASVLPGHTTEETAYVVADYPYGFKLRCKIRYWLEYNPKRGFRLVSRTTNPKVQGREVWNAPKASTYTHLAVMGLDANGHVKHSGVRLERDQMEQFYALYGASFDDNQKKVYAAIMKAIEHYEKRKAGQKPEESGQ